MNILRPLSPHRGEIWKGRDLPFLFLATIVLFFYLLCLKIGLIGCFFSWVSKVGFILGGRALSFVLLKLGCSGGLTLWIVLPLRALLTPEAAPYLGNLMLPNGADVGASSSAGGVTEAPLSISDLAKPVNTSSTDPSQIIYRAPGPGGPVEILEIPESPPAPLSVEEEEQLLTKREEVKFLIRVLLQIGYNKRARNEKEIKQLFQDIDIDSERNATFLEELHDHLRGLRRPGGHGGTSGQPKKFSNIEVQELLRWISEKRGN